MAPLTAKGLVRRGYQDLRILGALFLLISLSLLLRDRAYHLGRALLYGLPAAYALYRIVCFFSRKCMGESPYRIYLIGLMVLGVILMWLKVVPPFAMLVLLGIDTMLVVRQVARGEKGGPKRDAGRAKV